VHVFPQSAFFFLSTRGTGLSKPSGLSPHGTDLNVNGFISERSGISAQLTEPPNFRGASAADGQTHFIKIVMKFRLVWRLSDVGPCQTILEMNVPSYRCNAVLKREGPSARTPPGKEGAGSGAPRLSRPYGDFVGVDSAVWGLRSRELRRECRASKTIGWDWHRTPLSHLEAG
jgi:hypothetical protein